MKVYDERCLGKEAVHIALGIQPDGTREVLGLWISQIGGTKCWLRLMNELETRGF